MNQKEHLQNMIKDLSDMDFLLCQFFEDIATIPRSDIILRVSDFDYTIFSRDEQLEGEAGLRENRGAKWNSYILYQLGLPYLIDTYYKDKDFPKDIIEQMNPEYDLILTAGMQEIQEAKLQALWLDHFPLLVTKDGQDKILALIRYVIYVLKFIPKEIIVYEDRPQYFVEYRELIEWVLGTKLTLNFVEMDGNKGYTSISEISY